MSKVITNCRVLQCENGNYFIAEKEICVDEGYVCDNVVNPEIVDLQHRILMPTYFNIHSHLGESVFKDISGVDWTLDKYLAYTEEHNKRLSAEERNIEWYKSACYSAEEMMNSGTTGFCAARSADIANRYQMNTMAGYPIMNSEKLKSYISAGEEGFLNYLQKYCSNRSSVGVFLHSLYMNSEESLVLAMKCMELGAEFLTIHISEDEDSRKKEVQRYGKKPIEVLEEYKLLHEKTILVHGGYLSLDELELIRKSGATIAICPISNAFLNTKMIRIDLLEELQIPWCIATDGLGTGRTFSLPEQVRFVRSHYPNIDVKKFYSSITTSPAKCYARQHYTGNIEVGTEARFLVVNYMGEDIDGLLTKMLYNGTVYEYHAYE